MLHSFGHRHNNAHGPYIIMLHWYSTHKYAQWGVVLMTDDYCAHFSFYGCMPVYVFVYVLNACNQTFPPLTNCCCAAASLWGQLLSPWKLSILSIYPEDLSSTPARIFSGCVYSCMCFIRSGIYNWLVRLIWQCTLSAITDYFKEQCKDGEPLCFQYQIHAFPIIWECDLFGYFHVGQRKANAC